MSTQQLEYLRARKTAAMAEHDLKVAALQELEAIGVDLPENQRPVFKVMVGIAQEQISKLSLEISDIQDLINELEAKKE